MPITDLPPQQRNPLLGVGDPEAPLGRRIDGTPKGKGYFGFLKRPDGRQSTEISVGVNFDGKETQIPTLVPTLSQDEINYLVNDWKEGVKIPDVIMNKAVEHAQQRMQKGFSPFAD